MGASFPYTPRQGQEEIVEALERHLAEMKHIAMQSGTGTGKTICALSASVAAAQGNSRKVLYLTRTNSQQKQVMVELRAIASVTPVFGIAIQGRRNMCPYIEVNEELKSGTHEELSLLCGQKKNKVIAGDASACKFFHTLISTDHSAIDNWARKHLPTAEEFSAYCSERGYCPYELLKTLSESAKVVTAPYIYFFNPFIRGSLLDWMGCGLEDLLVIVDEAHNLPEYARELRTAEMSFAAIKAAAREAAELNDPEVVEGTSASDLLNMIEEVLKGAVKEYVLDEDGLVPSGLLEEALMSRLTLTSRGLLKVAGEIVNLGDIIKDRRRKEGRLPRSYLSSIGAFLEAWSSFDEEDYVKLVVGGENPRFEAYCLDPSIACKPLLGTHGSIHMSGTLEPLEEYKDSIGLPESSPSLNFKSPFPRENLKVLYADDVTSKYEDMAKDAKNLSRMLSYISGIASQFQRNTVAFFPSYNLMEKFACDDQISNLERPVFREEKGMPQDDLMEIVGRFKDSIDGALLLAVSGGRISEGIDFPDRELEIAILVGIPYPKPTARARALQHFYEVKFGKGWDYVVKAPATRKMLQSIGRLIRSETDRGVAIILDKRAVHLKPYISAVLSKDPVGEMKEFFATDREVRKIPIKRRQQQRPRTSKS
jgi:DNA excision repair protein ERCC-2